MRDLCNLDEVELITLKVFMEKDIEEQVKYDEIKLKSIGGGL